MQYGWKAVWSIPYVSLAFFPSLKQNFIAYSSKVSHVQIAFLKFTSYDNQALVGCIPIAAVATHLNVKSQKLVSHLIRCIAIKSWRVYDNFKCLYKRSLETYWKHRVFILLCCVVYWWGEGAHKSRLIRSGHKNFYPLQARSWCWRINLVLPLLDKRADTAWGKTLRDQVNSFK